MSAGRHRLPPRRRAGRANLRPTRVAIAVCLAIAVVASVSLWAATHRQTTTTVHSPLAATRQLPVHPTSYGSAPSLDSIPASVAPLPTGASTAAAPAPAALTNTPQPVHLAIPAIGVNTDLEALNLLSNGNLQAPSQWQVAGWYAGGVRPGDAGPAVIAGHVDSTSGPAVFYHLSALRPGDTATVTRADNSVLTFVIDTVDQYPKGTFPTQAVYGPTSLPVLRLVTCTGDFDYITHNYLDNLVVSAHLAGS